MASSVELGGSGSPEPRITFSDYGTVKFRLGLLEVPTCDEDPESAGHLDFLGQNNLDYSRVHFWYSLVGPGRTPLSTTVEVEFRRTTDWEEHLDVRLFDCLGSVEHSSASLLWAERYLFRSRLEDEGSGAMVQARYGYGVALGKIHPCFSENVSAESLAGLNSRLGELTNRAITRTQAVPE